MPTSGGGESTPIRSPEALGRVVRAARLEAGLTQSALAERTRANRYAIHILEAGNETRAVELIFDALAALELELVVRPRRRD